MKARNSILIGLAIVVIAIAAAFMWNTDGTDAPTGPTVAIGGGIDLTEEQILTSIGDAFPGVTKINVALSGDGNGAITMVDPSEAIIWLPSSDIISVSPSLMSLTANDPTGGVAEAQLVILSDLIAKQVAGQTPFLDVKGTTREAVMASLSVQMRRLEGTDLVLAMQLAYQELQHQQDIEVQLQSIAALEQVSTTALDNAKDVQMRLIEHAETVQKNDIKLALGLTAMHEAPAWSKAIFGPIGFMVVVVVVFILLANGTLSKLFGVA
ncbi:hypothetical protein HYV31_02730 [candidate division WWE3 bacterium]|nr:hypothetical protein [candidate division WWE3 bacterium]